MNPFDTIASFFAGNPMVTGGLTLAITGGLIAMLRNVPKTLLAHAKRVCTVSAEIREEAVFSALAEWLAAHAYGERCRELSVGIMHSNTITARRREAPTLVFSPGIGLHVIRHRGRLFWIERKAETQSPMSGIFGDNPMRRESFTIRMLGRDVAAIREMMQAAVLHSHRQRHGKAVLYTQSRWAEWKEAAINQGRPLNSVVLTDGLMEELVADIETFIGSRPWYESMGIPYRRGYMLYGPPGTGKSSAVAALAAHFGLSLYNLSIAGKGISDGALMELIQATEPGSIILLEDIDAAFDGRAAANESKSEVTFSGLLNSIDGIVAQQGRLFFLTTNHADRLDPALIRAGRIDVPREIGLCDGGQLSRMYLRFFPGAASTPHTAPFHAEAFAARVMRAHGSVAPCDIQRYLASHRDDPAGACHPANIAKMELPPRAEPSASESPAPLNGHVAPKQEQGA